jgi:DNA-binding transcriptional LysR family regulator
VELRHLQYFVTVAEERNFRRAASRLHIAAPSLSQQIRALERELDVTLFDRSSRGVASTPAGKVLLGHARVMLARAQRARQEVVCADTLRERFTLCVEVSVEHVLGEALRGLPAVAPRLEITTMTSTGLDAICAVCDERADAAVVWVCSRAERSPPARGSRRLLPQCPSSSRSPEFSCDPFSRTCSYRWS